MRRPGWRALAALALAALGVWSVTIEPRWIAARTETLDAAAWGAQPRLRIAVASDWHLTEHPLWRVTGVERARRIVDDINAARPDLVLLPGDFLAGHDGDESLPIDAMAEVLGRLAAPLGVYAVLGNHDWWHDGARIAQALSARGIVVLENDAVPLPLPGRDLWVVGIGDLSTGHARPGRALAKVPADAATLVLMHDPASLAGMPHPTAAAPVLTVAGHTHGGQVWVPGYGAPFVPGAAPRTWAHGWVEHRGRRMYVTSGLGVSILPVRLNMRPEWVLFD